MKVSSKTVLKSLATGAMSLSIILVTGVVANASDASNAISLGGILHTILNGLISVVLIAGLYLALSNISNRRLTKIVEAISPISAIRRAKIEKRNRKNSEKISKKEQQVDTDTEVQ